MPSFHQRPDVCRGLGIARSDRDFTDPELDLLVLLAPHLEAEYRRATVASKLTPRELEVVALVGQGLTNREIARQLDVSPGTVRSHLEHTYAKLGVAHAPPRLLRSTELRIPRLDFCRSPGVHSSSARTHVRFMVL